MEIILFVIIVAFVLNAVGKNKTRQQAAQRQQAEQEELRRTHAPLPGQMARPLPPAVPLRSAAMPPFPVPGGSMPQPVQTAPKTTQPQSPIIPPEPRIFDPQLETLTTEPDLHRQEKAPDTNNLFQPVQPDLCSAAMLREFIVAKEILDRPVALRPKKRYGEVR